MDDGDAYHGTTVMKFTVFRVGQGHSPPSTLRTTAGPAAPAAPRADSRRFSVFAPASTLIYQYAWWPFVTTETMPKARSVSSTKAAAAAAATKTSGQAPPLIGGVKKPKVAKKKAAAAKAKISKTQREAKDAAAAKTKISKVAKKIRTLYKQLHDDDIRNKATAKTNKTANRMAMRTIYQQLHGDDINEKVRIMTRWQMPHAAPKMCHQSSGRFPGPSSWSYMWVERGSLDHQRAIRGELVLVPGQRRRLKYAFAPLC